MATKESEENGTDALFTGVDAMLAVIAFPPVATILNSVRRTITSLRDEMFVENLKAFFEKAEQCTQQERDAFFIRMGNDKDRFIRNVLISIEEVREAEIATIIGRLYINLVRNRFGHRDFQRLVPTLERLHTFDIVELETFRNNQAQLIPMPDDTARAVLIANGLIVEANGIGANLGDAEYQLSSLGSLLIRFGMTEPT